MIRPENNPVDCLAVNDYTGYNEGKNWEACEILFIKARTSDTAGLPYLITLTIDFPYMLTSNLNIPDGLVNGASGKLEYIEYDIDNRENIKRLLLLFENRKYGALTRSKYALFVNQNPFLKKCWTPMKKKSTNISFKIRQQNCRRLQFSLIESNAQTIQKGQGGSFQEVVYDYHKNHDQKLVYVALSRVTSIEGLRLEKHPLKTIVDDCNDFLIEKKDLSLAIINVQSLRAHYQELENDEVYKKVTLLLMTETRMDDAMIIHLQD